MRSEADRPTSRAVEAYTRYRREIEQFFAARLPDRGQSEDLCHEVFLRFLLAEAAGLTPDSSEAWLRRVARNLLVDTFRRSATSGVRELTLSDEAGRGLADVRTVTDQLEPGELAGLIVASFQALTRRSRLLLHWREIDRVPVRTIAQRMRASPGVVATELSRARKHFRRHYLRLRCSGLLEPDEEIFNEAGTLRSFDPLGAPEDQLDVIEARVHAYYIALQLATHVSEVIAVDTSPAMLRRAAWKASRAGLSNICLREGRAESLPVETGSIDVAVCHMVLHHVISQRRVLQELRRVVRPGGCVALLDSDRHTQEWMLTRFADVHCGVDRQRLRRQLERAGFELVILEDAGSWETVGGAAALFSAFLAVARASERSTR